MAMGSCHGTWPGELPLLGFPWMADGAPRLHDFRFSPPVSWRFQVKAMTTLEFCEKSMKFLCTKKFLKGGKITQLHPGWLATTPPSIPRPRGPNWNRWTMLEAARGCTRTSAQYWVQSHSSGSCPVPWLSQMKHPEQAMIQHPDNSVETLNSVSM